MRGLFEPWHLLILLVVIMVLFGGKKLPEAARGLGRSMRIFKSEVKEMREEDKREDEHRAQERSVEGRVVGSEGTVPPPAVTPNTAPAAAPSEPAPSAQPRHDA